MKNLKSKKAYEEYLNTIYISADSPNWWIGGKNRNYYQSRSLYGKAIRKFDPIQFEVGYQDWKRRQK